MTEQQTLILVGSKYALMDLIRELHHGALVSTWSREHYNNELRGYKPCIEASFRSAWDRLAAFSQDARLSEYESAWLKSCWLLREET